MTTIEELSTALAMFEKQIREQDPHLEALLAALNDCDPGAQLAISPDDLPEIPARRAAPTVRLKPLPPMAIRA